VAPFNAFARPQVSIELDPKKERIVRCPMPEIQAQVTFILIYNPIYV
jgi:hypothetical protein